MAMVYDSYASGQAVVFSGLIDKHQHGDRGTQRNHLHG
jgi:hypothetical protein